MSTRSLVHRYVEWAFGQNFANERLEIFFQTVWRPLVGGVIASSGVCGYFYHQTGSTYYIWFVAGYIAVAGARFVSAYLYFRRRELLTLPLWHVVFNAGMFLNGLLWSLLGLWAAHTGRLGLILFSLITVAGVVTVNLISYPSNRLSHYLYAPMVTLPMTIWLLIYSDNADLRAASLLLILVYNPMVIFASMSSFKVVIHFLDQSAKKGMLDSEIENAKTVQETLFPRSSARFGSIDISGFYEPAGVCGGDWWHYSRVNNKIYMGIGDATGHGLPAALITSAASSAFSIIEEMELTPAKGLEVLNRAIHANSQGRMMMTFFMAVYDLETQILTYANASHEPPLLMTAENLKAKGWRRGADPLQEVNGSRLGEALDSNFQEARVKLRGGDIILFYTDGLVDLVNSSNFRWGERNLMNTLERSLLQSGPSATADRIVTSVTEKFRAYANAEPIRDDVTFFAFCVQSREESQRSFAS